MFQFATESKLKLLFVRIPLFLSGSSGSHQSDGAEQAMKHISDKLAALETQTDSINSLLDTLLLTNKPATIQDSQVVGQCMKNICYKFLSLRGLSWK